MQRIVIYSPAELAAVAADALAAEPREVWRARVLAELAQTLKKWPGAYRTFGPYWWVVKRQLVDAGLHAGEVKPDALAAIATGDDDLDLLGALLYHGYNVDQMRLDGVTFSVDTDDGDTIDYVLDDPEAEERTLAAG